MRATECVTQICAELDAAGIVWEWSHSQSEIVGRAGPFADGDSPRNHVTRRAADGREVLNLSARAELQKYADRPSKCSISILKRR